MKRNIVINQIRGSHISRIRTQGIQKLSFSKSLMLCENMGYIFKTYTEENLSAENHNQTNIFQTEADICFEQPLQSRVYLVEI